MKDHQSHQKGIKVSLELDAAIFIICSLGGIIPDTLWCGDAGAQVFRWPAEECWLYGGVGSGGACECAEAAPTKPPILMHIYHAVVMKYTDSEYSQLL